MSLRVGDDVRADFAGKVIATGPGWVVIRAGEGGVVWQVPVVLDVPVGASIRRIDVGKRDANPPPVTITITADTSKFDAAMRRLKRDINETVRVIGERLIDGFRPVVYWLNFRMYLARSGQRVCTADHEDLVGRCPACKAST